MNRHLRAQPHKAYSPKNAEQTARSVIEVQDLDVEIQEIMVGGLLMEHQDFRVCVFLNVKA